MIRIATKEDAAAMLEIYSPFILNSGITQETEVPAVAEFQQRIISNLAERPWLVCEIDEQVAGYAYASKHRERKGYQWCVETSVYVSENFYRYNAATALYNSLFQILKLQKYVNAYAVITLPNEKSISFHERFGFSYFTTFKNIGFKLDQWHDVGWWHRLINPATETPPALISFPDLDKNIVEAILSNSSLLVRKK